MIVLVVHKDKRKTNYIPGTWFGVISIEMIKYGIIHTILSVCIMGRSLEAFTPSSRSPIRTDHLQQAPCRHQRHASLVSLALTKSNSDVCTVQILMSDTGGSHRASANALRDAFDVLYPGKFECDIVDIYTEYGPFWPFNGYVEGYKLMAKYTFLWDIFYRFGETDLGLWLNDFLLTVFCFDPFTECLAKTFPSTGKRADMVVSVHPLCQDLPLTILAHIDSNGLSKEPQDRTTPFVTVVTDLGGAHKTWFNPGVDKCFVPSDVLNEKARSRGLDPSQIVQYGLPIRKGFWSREERQEMSLENPVGLFKKLSWRGRLRQAVAKGQASESLRSNLGIDEDLPAVLVVGGDGLGGIVNIAKALGDKLGKSASTPEYQLVIVCGKNEAAQQQLSGEKWGPGVKVHVKGVVNNMDEWMRASDFYLPGQEEGNVPFVENSGFGKYSADPKVIADALSSWLISMNAAALAAARASATLDIAKDLADIAFAKKLTKDNVLVRVREDKYV